jgi:hypothetical protein
MAGELLEAMRANDGGIDGQARARVTVRFMQVIEGSFREDRSRFTGSEVKRRFQICERWFRELRAEHGWSVPRILDNLPRILRAQLDGAPFDPTTERQIWTPGGT